VGRIDMHETAFATKKAKSEADVISFYEEYAPSWDNRFGNSFATGHFINRRWRSFLDAVTHSNPSRDMAIELGVGTGVYIKDTSKIFKRIIAVDGSKKMLDVLQKKIDANNVSGVSLIQANVLHIEKVSDLSADCVYFFGLIEHILDMSAFVKEVQRILRNGGILIGVTPNGSSPWYGIRKIIRGTGKHCSSDKYYRLDELDRIFQSAGFQREYASHWGAVPAGIGDRFGRLLARFEPLIEKSPLKKYLGGLTFVYRRILE
jgi:ubiquinone/menaquinone biosynthesis C-methylase UbiE